MYKITEVVTHKEPSIDEWVAIWLLVQYGWANWDVKITFSTDADMSDSSKEREQLKNGVIYLGTGGGMFDEHPSRTRPRRENECAATLLAKYMGVDKVPEVGQILALALNDDLGTIHQQARDRDPDFQRKIKPWKVLSHFSLPKIIKTLYANECAGIDAVRGLVFTVLNENFETQLRFFRSSEICQEGEHITLHYKGKKFPLLIVNSDEKNVHDYAFAKTHAHLVLQFRTTGNWQLFSRDGSEMQRIMPAIAGALKAREAKLIEVEYDRAKLTEDGALEELPHIYYFNAQRAVFNGSLTHDQPATAMGQDDVVDAIETVVNLLNDKWLESQPVLSKINTDVVAEPSIEASEVISEQTFASL